MMELSQQSKPSLWYALLWKDLQQVKSLFTAAVAGVFGVQLILFLASRLVQDQETRTGFMAGIVTLPFGATIVLALGSCGMLIGHERQTGTWAWSSSLPVSWMQALASKLFVSIAGSLCVGIPLAILPVWFFATQATGIPEATESAFFVIGGLVIFIEVVTFCFIATLLMRDTLMALVVGAVALLIFNVFIPAWFALHSHETLHRWGVSADVAELTGIAVSICGIALTSVIPLAIAFRWRWGTGQRANLAFWERFRVASLPSKAQYHFAAGTVPSEFSMLLRHSATNSFWLRIAIVVGTLLMCLTSVTYEPDIVLLVVLTVSVCVLGITAFEGDRTLSRFRFLSDRGVDPRKLILSRVGIAALWAIATVVAVLVMSLRWRGFSERALFAIGLIPLAFLVGVFASMCFRKSLIAVGAASIVSIIALATTSSIGLLVSSEAGLRFGFQWVVLCFSPVPIVAILVGIFWLCKPWLVTDDASLGAHYIWITLAATLSPIFLACTFGFLLVPNVNLQFETGDFSLTRQVATPDIEALTEILSSEGKSLDSLDSFGELVLLARSRGRGLEGVSRSADSVVAQVSAELGIQHNPSNETLAAFFDPSIARLEEIMVKEPSRVEASKVPVSQLEHLIARTAALAVLAMKHEDAQNAVRLWKINRRLQELAQQLNPLETHASRNVSMYLLQQARNGEIVAMGGPDVFRTLIPSIALERTASLSQANQAYTLYRELQGTRDSSHRMTPMAQFSRYYPPVDWLIKRQMAVELDMQTKVLRQLPENFLTGQTRDALVARVSE
jgi:hypothetical protein